jgi:hypothetical protein
MVSFGLMVAKLAEQASSLGRLLVGLIDGLNGSGLAGSRLFPPTTEDAHFGNGTELERWLL